MHFYPRSPCGERRRKEKPGAKKKIISIHALLAESDNISTRNYNRRKNISIHALLAESDGQTGQGVDGSGISIHALLAESDNVAKCKKIIKQQISIHALLAESDTRTQSASLSLKYFYPRSPCGERPS